MKISIITVVRNQVGVIQDCLNSVASQTYSNWEQIVVDGASTDGTVSILEGVSDQRVEFLSEQDEGIYDGMNKGVSRVTGDVVGFLNSDDFYESSDVLACVAKAFEDKSVGIVYGNLKYVDSEDTGKVIRDWVSEPYGKGSFCRGWMPPHPTVYVRRSVFEEIGVFDQSFELCADWEWLFRAFELECVQTYHIDKYLIRMRMGGASNASLKNVFVSNKQAVRAFRKHGKRFPLSFYPGKLVHRLKQFT